MDQERHRKRVAEARAVLGGICLTCGTTEGLEFDHIDATTKRVEISTMNTYSNASFWEEVAKCQLLCREHHLDKQRENQEFRVQPPPGETVPGARHGSRTGYRHDACRCQSCRDANAAYFRHRRGVRA